MSVIISFVLILLWLGASTITTFWRCLILLTMALVWWKLNSTAEYFPNVLYWVSSFFVFKVVDLSLQKKQPGVSVCLLAAVIGFLAWSFSRGVHWVLSPWILVTWGVILAIGFPIVAGRGRIRIFV